MAITGQGADDSRRSDGVLRVTTRHLAAASALAFVGSTVAGSVVGLPGALAQSGLAEASVGGRALSTLNSSDVAATAVTAGAGDVAIVPMVAGTAPVQVVTPVPAGLAATAAGAAPAAAPEASAAALGIPAPVLDAYKKAAALKNQQAPTCQIDWTVLAGIGKVESNHASGGKLDAAGNTLGGIQGPMTPYGTAKGPMQFIDSSWKAFGADGNGDGVKNANNIYDAALGAANHLCSSAGGSMKNPDNLYKGIYGYNHADWYVQKVLALANQYAGGAVAVAPTPGVITPAPSVAAPAPVASPGKGSSKPSPSTQAPRPQTPSKPSAPAPSTPAPSTPAPSNPAPTTPAPSTPAPSEPAPTQAPPKMGTPVKVTAPSAPTEPKLAPAQPTSEVVEKVVESTGQATD